MMSLANPSQPSPSGLASRPAPSPRSCQATRLVISKAPQLPSRFMPRATRTCLTAATTSAWDWDWATAGPAASTSHPLSSALFMVEFLSVASCGDP